MIAKRLRLGDRVWLDGRQHRVISFGFEEPATVTLESGGAFSVVLLFHLLSTGVADDGRRETGNGPSQVAGEPGGAASADGAAEAAEGHADTRGTWLPLDRAAALDRLPLHVRREVERKERHACEVLTGRRDPAQPDINPLYGPSVGKMQRVQLKADELGVNPRTVRRWRDDYDARGVWGLIPKKWLTAHVPLANVDERLKEAVFTQLHVRDAGDSTAPGALGRFRRRLTTYLQEEYPDDPPEVPSDTQLQRIIDQHGHGGPGRSAQRRRNDAQLARRDLRSVTAHRPGEVVLIDETSLDVKGYDYQTDTIVDLNLLAAIDLYTRSLVAWRLVPVAKAVDAALLLHDMVSPLQTRPNWPEQLQLKHLRFTDGLVSLDERLVAAAARPIIWAERVIVDNGPAFTAGPFVHAARELRIDVQYTREGRPRDKPEIERAFGTIKSQFSAHVAGYTGGDPANRGIDVELAARWTVQELEDLFLLYVLSFYQRHSHRGLRHPAFPNAEFTPNNMWAIGVSALGYIALPPDPHLAYRLLPRKLVKIQPDGVHLNYLRYDNPEAFKGLRGMSSGYPRTDGKWFVSFDPRDLTHVFFQRPDTAEWHAVPWRHLDDRHQPFSDTLLKAARKLLAERGWRLDDQDALADMLLELQSFTDDRARSTGRTRKQIQISQRHARSSARDLHALAELAAADDDDDDLERDDVIDMEDFDTEALSGQLYQPDES